MFLRLLRNTLLLGILVFCIQAAYCFWLIARHAEQPAYGHADAAVVLGAAAWGNKPSPVFRERIEHGITLYREGRVGKLVFTGGTPKAGYMTEAEVARRHALSRGIPADDILYENTSRDTLHNLLHTKTLLDGAGLDSVIIVSDPDHLARAAAMAHYAGLNFQTEATPSSRYQGRRRHKFTASEVFSLMLFQWWALFHSAPD